VWTWRVQWGGKKYIVEVEGTVWRVRVSVYLESTVWTGSI
jgi:hypothetical protein